MKRYVFLLKLRAMDLQNMKRKIIWFIISEIYMLVTSVYITDKNLPRTPCKESLFTVKEGLRCPSNHSEWEKRAKAMKCENYTQNCIKESQFSYHCLINSWLNATIEVCAPEEEITGKFCAEFNKGGAFVQENYKSVCKRCPFQYNSRDSYKYQECYELVKIPEITTEQHMSTVSKILEEVPPTVSYEGNLSNFTKATDAYHGINNNEIYENTTGVPTQKTTRNEDRGIIQVEVKVLAVILCVMLLLLSLILIVILRRRIQKPLNDRQCQKTEESNSLKQNIPQLEKEERYVVKKKSPISKC